MSTLDRRSFIKRGGAVAAMAPLSALLANTAGADPSKGKQALLSPDNGGYGPLQPTAARNTGQTLISLPAGFSYVAVGEEGSPMTGGTGPTPGAHDGMAAFATANPNVVRLVRNHEEGAGVPFATPAYGAARGGTTTLEFNIATQTLMATYPTLAGTVRNCAGGPTPWGSWLSGEETNDVTTQQHGYLFEVPSAASAPVTPVPLKAMGAFSHEAAAVDPATGIVYETEDSGASGLFRFIPAVPGNLAAGGELQMLAIKGRPQYDTRTGQRLDKPLPVEWVTIEDPDPAGYAADEKLVYKEGFGKGGASFARLEGIWYHAGSLFFVSTSGGDVGEGQVFEYRPRGASGGQLVLRFESPGREVLHRPDNITVSPGGALMLFEDGSGTNFVRGVTQRGQIFDFAENLVSPDGDGNTSEFAGGCWSPDGSTLFFNRQSGPTGVTFAVTGPFEQGAL